MVKALLALDAHVKLSISHTTRKPRPGETDGVDYHFVNEAHFLSMLDASAFLESAHVHHARYGTSEKAVNEALSAGHDVILEIDWQGAEQVRKLFHRPSAFFILPPSLETLAERLKGRAQDSDVVIEKRLAVAREEMRHLVEFDYVTINDKFDDALHDLIAIIQTQRLKTNTQLKRHSALIQTLV